jgi:hypothetical protein
MTTVYINPGSGPCIGTRQKLAASNARALRRDVGLPCSMTYIPKSRDGGRYTFIFSLGGRKVEVEVPGLPLAKVRWMDEPGQNIWHFPRLYVNGSSWVWKFAVGQLRFYLTGHDEEAA